MWCVKSAGSIFGSYVEAAGRAVSGGATVALLPAGGAALSEPPHPDSAATPSSVAISTEGVLGSIPPLDTRVSKTVLRTRGQLSPLSGTTADDAYASPAGLHLA